MNITITKTEDGRLRALFERHDGEIKLQTALESQEDVFVKRSDYNGEISRKHAILNFFDNLRSVSTEAMFPDIMDENFPTTSTP